MAAAPHPSKCQNRAPKSPPNPAATARPKTGHHASTRACRAAGESNSPAHPVANQHRDARVTAPHYPTGAAPRSQSGPTPPPHAAARHRGLSPWGYTESLRPRRASDRVATAHPTAPARIPPSPAHGHDQVAAPRANSEWPMTIDAPAARADTPHQPLPGLATTCQPTCTRLAYRGEPAADHAQNHEVQSARHR